MIKTVINYLNKIASGEMCENENLVAIAANNIFKSVNAGRLECDNADKKALEAAITEVAEKLVSGQVSTKVARILFAAYMITNNEKYSVKITELRNAEPTVGLDFDMTYETLLGGKEHYHEIAQATAMREAWIKGENTEDMQMTIGSAAYANPDSMVKAKYLVEVIETIEAIDQPVYEHYRTMVDAFRRTIRSLIKVDDENINTDNAVASMLIAYATKKACDMKVILTEKYMAKAEKTMEQVNNEESALYVLLYNSYNAAEVK